MVGNHCVEVLKHYKVLTNVIKDKPTDEAHFDDVFKILSDIMEFVMARRFLTDDEITILEGNCYMLGERFPLYFPVRNITRKIHELVFNVPRFVKKWRTIGMLSEQEGESKHAAVNAELRSLACVRNHAEQIRLILEREELRSISDKNLLKAKPRICRECPGRSFLRSARDGERHCPVCNPTLF